MRLSGRDGRGAVDASRVGAEADLGHPHATDSYWAVALFSLREQRRV